MRILLFLTALSFLKLISCAEETKGEVPGKTINDLSSAIVYEIAKFLDDPFSTLGETNEYFKGILSIEFNVKRFFNERFHIPELVTADVDDNEEELKYLLKYSKFAKFSDHVYQAFRHEFLYGDEIDTLIPNFLNYFDRYDPKRSTDEGKGSKDEEIDALIRRKKFDFFFKGETPRFTEHVEKLFSNLETIKSVQEYFLSNDSLIEHVFDYFDSLVQANELFLNYIRNWIKVALYNNMPDMFFKRYPTFLIEVIKAPGFWTNMIIPESRYHDLFDRINSILYEQEFTEDDRKFYLLLNAIRFGPVVSFFYETYLKSIRFSKDRVNLMCHCASLSNKFDIFSSLFDGNQSMLLQYNFLTYRDFENDNTVPIEMHKYAFDAYRLMPDELRQSFYTESHFIEIVSKYYFVSSINWENVTLNIEFQAPSELIDSEFPQTINIQYTYKVKYELLFQIYNIPLQMRFLNVTIFGYFLSRYLNFFESGYFINGENLKFILKSSDIRGMLNNYSSNLTQKLRPFTVDFNELLKLVDEPNAVSLIDFVDVVIDNTKCLADLKTSNQLKNLEIILGHDIAFVMLADYEFFKYRQVFQHLNETGSIAHLTISDENRYLARIDSEWK